MHLRLHNRQINVEMEKNGKMKGTQKMRNDKVLKGVEEKLAILETARKCKRNRLGH